PAAEGAVRTVVVRFDDSRYLPPDNPHQLREAFEQFCEKAQAIGNPHEQAFFTMAFIPYLQPFQDGNKRTSRLGMNIPLVKASLAPFSFADIMRRDYMLGLLAFYERGRHQILADAFVQAYGKSASRYAELVMHINAGGLLGSLAH
ncbi:MAG TPA: Fic family protein, partial [Steroidobacteraceae bacterium]|nr:Fic family protein [Steroidobacteraceae bacterium]